MSATKERALRIIAGRNRITPEDAIDCMGRDRSRTDDLSFYGIPVEDGTCSAGDVLCVLERRAAQRRVARQELADATLTLQRRGWTSWLVHAPWGPLGRLEVCFISDAPLAYAPEWLPVWVAEAAVGDGQPMAAVSAKAAQVLLARHVAPAQIIEPGWGTHVRPLDVDLVGDLTRHVYEVMNGRAAPSTQLTDWERKHAMPVVHPDYNGVTDDRRPKEVPTPAGLRLQSRSNTRAPQWGIRAVARHLLVSPSTVEGYQLPEPDGMAGGAPWWRPATIRGWEVRR